MAYMLRKSTKRRREIAALAETSTATATGAQMLIGFEGLKAGKKKAGKA